MSTGELKTPVYLENNTLVDNNGTPLADRGVSGLDNGGSSDGSTTYEDVTTTAYTLTDADFGSDGTAKTKRLTNVAGCEVLYQAGLALVKGQRVEFLDVSGLSTFVDDGTSVLTSLAGQYTSAGAGAKTVIECTGTNTAKLYGEYGMAPVSFTVPLPQDPDTALTTGTAKATFRMPFAMSGATFRASLKTASSSGNPTFDINEAGVSVLSTKLSIDANEKTSVTATTPAVVSDPDLADDAEITIDIDAAGTGATGAAITFYGWTPA